VADDGGEVGGVGEVVGTKDGDTSAGLAQAVGATVLDPPPPGACGDPLLVAEYAAAPPPTTNTAAAAASGALRYRR
jgi:hypothetical protein